jgi:O-antigen/teichoic acid export membrane protein
VSAFEGQGQVATIRNLLLKCTRYSFYFTLIMQCGVILLGDTFLTLWLGEKYATDSYATLVILMLPFGIQAIQSVAARVIYGVGAVGWFARAALVQAASNLLLSLLLVKPFGIEGVAMGTAIPNLAYSMLVGLYACRITELSYGHYLRQSVLLPSLLVSLPCAIWLAARIWLSPISWTTFFTIGVIGVLAYSVLIAGAEVGLGALRQLVRRQLIQADLLVSTSGD